MHDFASDWIVQLIRISVVLSLSVITASVMFELMRAKPARRVVAWLLVLVPSWLLFSITLPVPWYVPDVAPSADSMSIVALFQHQVQWPESTGEQFDSDVAAPSQTNFVPIVLVAVWLMGMLVLLGKYVQVYIQVSRRIKSFPEAGNARWLAELGSVFAESKLPCQPELRVSDRLGPLACRVGGRNCIVVPFAFWNHCSSAERLAILQHERSHLERGDLWVSLLGRLLLLPQWFNPIAWFALKRFDEAIEMACDDHVLGSTHLERIEYAKSLLALVEFSQSAREVPTFTIATAGPPIRQRIQRIIQPKGIEMKFTKTLTLCSLVGLSSLALLRLELVAQEPSRESSHIVEVANIPSVVSEVDKQSKVVRLRAESDERLQIKAYYVGDLVIPIERVPFPNVLPEPVMPPGSVLLGGITEADFVPIKQLVLETVQPESWGDRVIEVYVPNLSLIVSQTETGHAEIVELLKKVRKLALVSIKLEARVVVVEEGQTSVGNDWVGKPIAGKEFRRLLEQASQASIAAFEYSAVELFSGQTYDFKSKQSGDLDLSGLKIAPVLRGDLKGVSLILGKHEKESAVVLDQSKWPALRFGKPAASFEHVPVQQIFPLNGSSTNVIGNADIANRCFVTVDVTALLENNDANRKAILYVRSTVIDRRQEIKDQNGGLK